MTQTLTGDPKTIIEENREFIKSLVRNSNQHAFTRHDLNSDGEPYKDFYERAKFIQCYGPMRKRPDHGCFLIGARYICKKDDEVGNKYWDWLTGENSPWRQILTGEIERVYLDDGRQIGYLLHQDIVGKGHWLSILSFMIALRQWAEEHDRIHFWYEVVNAGINESDAFIIASLFTRFNGDVVRKHPDNSNHWPINLSHFTRRRFVEGDLNTDKNPENGLGSDYVFHDTNGGYNAMEGYEYIPEMKPIREIKSTWSSVGVYNFDDVIKGYKYGNN